mgnify:CR=1 FL=1
MSKYSETEQIFFSGVVYGFEQPALSILSIRDYRNAKSRIEKVANQPPSLPRIRLFQPNLNSRRGRMNPLFNLNRTNLIRLVKLMSRTCCSSLPGSNVDDLSVIVLRTKLELPFDICIYIFFFLIGRSFRQCFQLGSHFRKTRDIYRRSSTEFAYSRSCSHVVPPRSGIICFRISSGTMKYLSKVRYPCTLTL